MCLKQVQLYDIYYNTITCQSKSVYLFVFQINRLKVFILNG